MLYVSHVIKVKVGIPERFKLGWYRHKITGLSHLKKQAFTHYCHLHGPSLAQQINCDKILLLMIIVIDDTSFFFFLFLYFFFVILSYY